MKIAVTACLQLNVKIIDLPFSLKAIDFDHF